MATRQRPLCHEKASEGDQGEHEDNVLCADIPEVSRAAVGGKEQNGQVKLEQVFLQYNPRLGTSRE